MPIDRTLQSWKVKTVPGMNNKTEDLDQQDKWVSIAQNCRFENEIGTTDKRDPVTFFNSSSVGTGAILGLHRFYTSSGTIKFVAVHGTQCYVGDDGAGTFTSIRTGLTTGKRATFQVYRDLLYVSNGFDNIFIYDGASDNVTWEMGACKALLGSGAGLLDPSATYTYAVTFDGDAVVNGAVSNTITTDGSNQKIELSNIPLGPSGTTDRKIYRTDGNGAISTLKLLTTIGDNSTTVFSDNIADASLTTAYPSVTDDIPKGQIIQVHRERMFITVDPNAPNKIYYSNVFLPHYIQQTTNLDFLEIAPEDGDEISGIPIQLGVMVCIKKNTIRRVHVTSATSGAQPETWFADDPIAFVGSPAIYSITQTPVGIYFLSWDHWYRFDGANALPVIGEFDTQEILPASFSDTVGFWHQGIFLAAYTDVTLAPQFHNRVMRWNVKRAKLSYDQWTSTSISGANVFASKSGDDETGELYYGDSVNGYVVKEKTSEDVYRLSTKTEVEQGTQTNVFIGGTENAPSIEPGSATTAGTIPDDIIIFWDNETTTPGSGWTEITSTYDGRLLSIDSSSGTLTASTTHSHTVAGDLPNSGEGTVNTGDQGSFGNFTLLGHTHTFSATSSTVTDQPRHIKLRMFKSASASTTEFPIGAIIMWDQADIPTGYENLDVSGVNTGFYVQAGSTGLNSPIASAHTHTYSATSSAVTPLGESTDANQSGAGGNHTHSVSGTTSSADLSGWELSNVALHMIKKIGEADTWDGSAKFAYVLVEGVSTPTGWTIDTTWDGRFLKVGVGVPTTGSAAGSSHTHPFSPSGTSGNSSPNFGDSGNTRTQGRAPHTHSFNVNSVSTTSMGTPSSVSFRLFKLELGKMKDYNAGILVAATGPHIWESPCIQLNSEELKEISWNETLVSGDNVTFETRVGATQAACEAAAYTADLLTDPNGSDISSSPNIWFSYKMTFTAPDTTVSIPKVFFTNGFVVKVTYSKSASNAESSVSFKYEIGFRNFDSPMFDKIFKKINSRHEGSVGSFDVYWETENASNTFTVNLTANPKKWKSYFPDDAMGAEINFRVTKTDLNAFRIRELFGVYSPEAEQA